MTGRAVGALVLSALLLTGCGPDDKPAQTAMPAGGPADGAPSGTAGDPAKGRQVWLGQCIACHNSDPSKAGTVGPPVKGASRELLTDKLLRGAYPDGYTPKRPTAIMPQRPDLAAEIPHLSAYLR